MAGEENIFLSLPVDELKKRTSGFEVGYDFLELTLLNGDILLGGIAKYWTWNGKTIDIGYNTASGKCFGMSCVAPIPIELIADIKQVPLADDSIPKLVKSDEEIAVYKKLGFIEEKYALLPVQDYPNPLATIIFQQNEKVCENLGIKIGGIVEASLSRDSIPPEGIFLKSNFLLYADWDHFSRQRSGSISVNAGIAVAGIAKDLSPSLQDFIFSFLSESINKARKTIKVVSPFGLEEFLVQGCLLVPRPYTDTEIEGEACILAYCANSKEDDPQGSYPVLLKKRCIKYPIEFLDRISSSLYFYGEMIPIPIEILGIKHEITMLTRAIGFFR